MSKYLIITIISIVLLTSCTKKTIDVLKLGTIEEDSTISIVATGVLIWRPLGDLSTLQSTNKNIFKIKDSVEIDSSKLKLVIKNFSFGKSSIKVASYKNHHYLIQADIRDGAIRMADGIKVGMTKLDFFELFMDNPELNSLKQYVVVEMSDPLGESINETFVFKNDRLNTIQMTQPYPSHFE